VEEDAVDDFSSRVLYNENHVVHKLLPVMNCDAVDAMSVRYSCVQQCQTQFHIAYRQLHKYRPSY